MNAACSLVSLLLLSVPLPDQPLKGPTLTITAGANSLKFSVAGPQEPFLGGVLLSLSPKLSHYFQGLPPLLSDFVVLGVGFAEQEFSVKVLQNQLPAGIPLHAQGIVVDGPGVQATDVATFVLDASVPETR